MTGAAGFLGLHVTESLFGQGWTVVAYCRPGDPIHTLRSEVFLELGDVTDPVRLQQALPECADAVFHLAANTSTWSKHEAAQFRVNVDGTAHVIAAAIAKGAARLVYTSSVSAFGWQPDVRISESTHSNATSHGDNYGRSKLAAERLIKNACLHRGLDAVILNPVNILGAYDTTNWSRQLILPVADGTLPVVPPGAATWMSVRDAAAAHVAAVDRGASGSNIVLGGVEASFLQVVREIERSLGLPLTNRATPPRVLWLLHIASGMKSVVTRNEPELSAAKYRRAVGNLLVDDSVARTELALGCTSLTDQIGETIAWLRSEGMLAGGSGRGRVEPPTGRRRG